MTTPSDTQQLTYPFVVRGHDGRLAQAPALFVMRRELHKRTGTLGGFNVMEHAGWDQKQISVRSSSVDTEQARVVTAGGVRTSSYGTTVRTATDLHRFVRRIKPDDHELIAVVDDEIADLEHRIKKLRIERKTLVQRAWKRGVQVWVDDVRPSSETPSGARHVTS